MPRGAPDPITGLTPQQELFAQGVAAGKTQADAYREAYPASSRWRPDNLHAKASNLAADDRVRARVTALRQAAEKQAISRIAYTVETAMAECQMAIDLAIEKGQPGALVSAVRLRAELQRLLVHQSETRSVDEFGVPRRKDEAEQLLERLRKEAKARSRTPAILPKD